MIDEPPTRTEQQGDAISNKNTPQEINQDLKEPLLGAQNRLARDLEAGGMNSGQIKLKN